MCLLRCTGAVDGHDSVQDAAIALELAFLKAQRGDAVGVAAPWNEDPVPKCSVLEGLVRQLVSVALCCLLVLSFPVFFTTAHGSAVV